MPFFSPHPNQKLMSQGVNKMFLVFLVWSVKARFSILSLQPWPTADGLRGWTLPLNFILSTSSALRSAKCMLSITKMYMNIYIFHNMSPLKQDGFLR